MGEEENDIRTYVEWNISWGVPVVNFPVTKQSRL